MIVLADREGARAVFRTRIQEYQDLLERINVSEFSEKEINYDNERENYSGS